jgi:hypothetical protein
MGAILGGLYAAGYGADSVWNIVTEQDWRLIFEPMVYRVGPRRSLRHATIRLQSGANSPLVARAYSPDWRITGSSPGFSLRRRRLANDRLLVGSGPWPRT